MLFYFAGMRKLLCLFLLAGSCSMAAVGQSTIIKAPTLTTPFEKSGGKQTATYAECIAFYQQLDKMSTKVTIKEMGMSDAGYPYHVVLYSNDGTSDPDQWHRRGQSGKRSPYAEDSQRRPPLISPPQPGY